MRETVVDDLDRVDIEERLNYEALKEFFEDYGSNAEIKDYIVGAMCNVAQCYNNDISSLYIANNIGLLHSFYKFF